jgi:hypothetical protein
MSVLKDLRLLPYKISDSHPNDWLRGPAAFVHSFASLRFDMRHSLKIARILEETNEGHSLLDCRISTLLQENCSKL